MPKKDYGAYSSRKSEKPPAPADAIKPPVCLRVVDGVALNVRRLPFSNAEIIGALPAGKEVCAEEIDFFDPTTEYVKIYCPEIPDTGYCMKKYLAVVKE